MGIISSVPVHIYQISSIASWDSVYQEELANFEEIGDEGEIWYVIHRSIIFYHNFFRFGSETIEKMVEWSLENIPPSSNASVLEIGRGMELFFLVFSTLVMTQQNFLGLTIALELLLYQLRLPKHEEDQ